MRAGLASSELSVAGRVEAVRWSTWLVLLAAACGGSDRASRPAPPVEQLDEGDMTRDQPVTGAAVLFRPRGRPEARVEVEVARTPSAIHLGLMHRTHLAPDGGMLFLFSRPKVQRFWMKNTLIPLDMIFVSADMVVAGVIENAAPRTTTRRTLPGVVSQYVVEVNAGYAAAHGIQAGCPVEFVRVPPAGD